MRIATFYVPFENGSNDVGDYCYEFDCYVDNNVPNPDSTSHNRTVTRYLLNNVYEDIGVTFDHWPTPDEVISAVRKVMADNGY